MFQALLLSFETVTNGFRACAMLTARNMLNPCAGSSSRAAPHTTVSWLILQYAGLPKPPAVRRGAEVRDLADHCMGAAECYIV